jgi:hypothetical protein
VFAILAGFFIASNAIADGSVGFDEAAPLLDAAPELRAYLFDSLCISRNGMATRVSGEYPLGGRRVSPYMFLARPKGDRSKHFALRIVAWPTLYGEDGKELRWMYGKNAPWDEAYRVEETFSHIELARPPYWIEGLESVNCDEPV